MHFQGKVKRDIKSKDQQHPKLWDKVEHAVTTVALYINSRKIKFISLNANGPMKAWGGNELVNEFVYLGSRIISAEAKHTFKNWQWMGYTEQTIFNLESQFDQIYQSQIFYSNSRIITPLRITILKIIKKTWEQVE